MANISYIYKNMYRIWSQCYHFMDLLFTKKFNETIYFAEK